MQVIVDERDIGRILGRVHRGTGGERERAGGQGQEADAEAGMELGGHHFSSVHAALTSSLLM